MLSGPPLSKEGRMVLSPLFRGHKEEGDLGCGPEPRQDYRSYYILIGKLPISTTVPVDVTIQCCVYIVLRSNTTQPW